MGGSTVVTIVSAILRNKVLAVLLGPAGVGLLGVYSSILSTVGAISGMGLLSSGIRQVAISAGNDKAFAITRLALKRTTLFLGFLGASALFLFSRTISEWTFGTDEHQVMIAILAIGVLLSVVSDYQMALLNGLRRISDLVRSNIWGAVLGTIFAIVVIYFIRDKRGIALFIIAGSVATFFASFWYSRSIQQSRIVYNRADIRDQIKNLLNLGFVFMSVVLMSVVTLLLVRVVIMQKLGIEAAGFFQASWRIAILYVGFVSQAMRTDYFPQLSSLAEDSQASNKLVNEQTEVMLLLLCPIILFMLTFTPIVIQLLYSSKFFPAIDILRWQILGTIFQVFSWSIGFIIVAKGMSKTYFFTDLLWHLLYIGIVLFGINHFGLNITGIGFFLAYVIYYFIIYFIVKKSNHFTWNLHNIYLFISLCLAAFLIFLLSRYSVIGTYVFGGLLTVLASIYSFMVLRKKLGKVGIKSII